MSQARISVELGDITSWDVDAIVNAANTTLLGGGGVDGAIHRAAGPELREACRRLGGCPTGEARITPGFKLRARWVIHTVGPVWRGGTHDEPALLGRCYTNSLAIAVEHGLPTIAFPAISTGAYGYPIRQATDLAVATVRAYLSNQPDAPRVRFCCHKESDLAQYRRALGELLGADPTEVLT